ncbi:MAG: tRNA (adenosine(37)-N6)-threonylcarbamoyltransferase complex dimerization subunit type 1 TsaB [Calditrichaeota bacterium]|nr:MAG: tRNA (adenosine(37)-N6)-threonylcarbamoyltransferase complex dimerization subunit type 1 TsaB [Calditrichota bacterium]
MNRKLVNHTTAGIYLLGIETSSLTCGIGISRDDDLLGEISLNLKNIHSERLAPMLHVLLESLSLSPQTLSGIILSSGPGSFTGLRIGYSIAKGLATSLNIPIVEIPTLDVWAYQTGYQQKPVLVVIDAHRGEIFCAMYRWEREQMQKVHDYCLISPEELSEKISEPVWIVGGDGEKLAEMLLPFLPEGSRILRPRAPYLQMWALLKLGFVKYNEKHFSDVASCEPMYMRAFRGVL